MCTRFEPTLMAFRSEAAARDVPIELIYVSSDRSEKDMLARSKALDMLAVPFDKVDELKKQHSVWSGSETFKLGFGRRSGVPAIVVLSPEGAELAFIDAERRGPQALKAWDLEDGVF